MTSLLNKYYLRRMDNNQEEFLEDFLEPDEELEEDLELEEDDLEEYLDKDDVC